MSTIITEKHVFNNEIPICDIYSDETKRALERIFLKFRISYYVEWQNPGFWQRVKMKFGGKTHPVYTIRINRADAKQAVELISGLDDMELREVTEPEVFP